MTEKQNIESYERVEINFSPEIPKMKKIADKTQVNLRYCLVEPFAYAHIYWDPKINELVYEIEQPELTEEENKNREQITDAMRNIINFESVVSKDQKSLLEYIDKRFKLFATEFGLNIPYESYKKIYYYLCRDFIGYNETEPLMRDYYIEDIECNGANFPVYVIHRVYRNLKTNLVFNDMDVLASFVEKLAQRAGKYVSYAYPVLDTSLPDGSRVNATYTKDISNRGPTFTIRKFTKTPWTPVQLLGFRTLSAEALAYMWMLIQYRMNVLIVGGTASGKTTLLNAIAFFIPPEARVVSIEDTLELNLPRENWLPSVVRSGTGSSKLGEVDLFALLKNSFRQAPDYVIVGEVRGKEAYVLFQGMASGHSSISTIHADSVETVIKRLQTPPIELSPSLLNILDAVCIMSHAIVEKKETRKLQKVVEIVNVKEDGTAITNTPFLWNAANDQFYFKSQSKLFEKISARYGLSLNELQNEFRRRIELLYRMFDQKVVNFLEVQQVINEYYKQPEKVLARFGVR